ncbi:MAG: protein-tyrosine phosphatase family protein [Pirellulaceae bacterium]
MPPTFSLAAHDSTPPTPWSYWVVDGQLLAGAFPGALDPLDHRLKIKTLVVAGIRTIINLMEEAESDHHGRPFAAYEQVATQTASPEAMDCARYSIRDLSVPRPQLMSEILEHIDRSLADGRPVYVHCWGGVGRTGTVIGCWLLRHGLAKRGRVFTTLTRLRRQDAERGNRMSPETEAQRQFVLNWPEK